MWPWRRRHLRGEPGTITVLLVACLLFLSTLVLATFGLLARARRPVADYGARLAAEQRIESAALDVLRLLAEDPTPDADSRFDPAWAAVGEPDPGAAGQTNPGRATLTIEDLSSRLNLNLIPGEFLRSAEFGAALLPGRRWQDLLQGRRTNGPFGSLASFAEWLDLEAAGRFFTVYGYVNRKTAAPEMVERLSEVRREADDSAESRSSEGARSPIMNAQPSVNVNLAPAEIVRAFVEFVESPRNGEEVARCLASSILAVRELQEIGPSELSALIAEAEGAWPEEGHPLFDQLGVRTWFWRITASDGRLRCVVTAARLPGQAPPGYALIERRFFNLSSNKE